MAKKRSNFEELTPRAKKIWKLVQLAPPSDQRDQVINRVVRKANMNVRSKKMDQP